MKPKFIFSIGLGWCGTTSIYHTLKNIKYAYSGWKKEIDCLNYFFNCTTNEHKLDKYDYFITYLTLATRQTDNSIISKINERDINDLIGPSSSLNSYIKFFLNLYEYCKDEYQSVGDFSNNILSLNEHDLKLVADKVSECFDVKCIISLRDPIRRTWSHAGSYTNINNKNRVFYEISKTHYGVPRATNKITDTFELVKKPYVELLNKCYNAFGKDNVCCLIMEDLYDKNNYQEKKKLENFLNIKIDEMYECVYVPDRGINSIKTNPLLKDQWDSDHHILTPEIYNNYRNRKDFVEIYSEFEKFYGHLPADWGSPIDYGYNQ